MSLVENNIKITFYVLAVEHLVREDYKIEAMDRVEAYVDTLLMRMQLIKDRPYVPSAFLIKWICIIVVFYLEKMVLLIQL